MCKGHLPDRSASFFKPLAISARRWGTKRTSNSDACHDRRKGKQLFANVDGIFKCHRISRIYSRYITQRIFHQSGKPEAILSVSKASSSHTSSEMCLTSKNPIPVDNSGANLLGVGQTYQLSFLFSDDNSYSLIGLKRHSHFTYMG